MQEGRFSLVSLLRAERRSVDNLVAYRWDGYSLRQEAVRNISTTGVYIQTEEQWPIGTVLALTMQREGPLESNPEYRIEMRAKVSRCGEDGVGLKFLLDDPESRQWDSMRENWVEQVKPRGMLGLVQIAEALLFLSRICPGEAEIVAQLICGRLSNRHLANAVLIALKAENRMAPVSDRLRADPNLVVRILEEGSCTDEDWLRHYWVGLFVASCAVDEIDESSPAFVELLSKLTTFPVRILTVVCTRATKVVAESGLMSAKPLACRIEELMQTTGSQGVQIERDLQRLSELGLIEKGDFNTATSPKGEVVHITPSSLGLDLFARCNGNRGSLRSFYAALPGHKVRIRV
jgi:hypothetical protein